MKGALLWLSCLEITDANSEFSSKPDFTTFIRYMCCLAFIAMFY
jgi:hypothetical protein